MILSDILSEKGITQYCVVPISNEFVLYPHKLEKSSFEHKNAIVCLFPYYVSSHPKDAVLSRYASAPDYHIVVIRILKEICEVLSSHYKDYSFDCFSDNSPYCEKDLAASGGLIIRGRNDIGLNDKYGQFFFIGEIVTDAPLPHEIRSAPSCCKDAPCIKACPTGAISRDGFKRELCLSYISQMSGADFNEENAKLFSHATSAWGCDICLNACVKNRALPDTPIADFKNTMPYISIDDIEALSNREYKEKYADRAFSSRSKNIMLRNLRHLKEKI